MTRLAFSTLGCPGAPVEEVIALARRHGAKGVELRCFAGELIAPDAQAETSVQIGQTLRQAGIEVVCLASYVQAGSTGSDVDTSLHRHLELARLAGASFLRVFGGDPADAGVGDRAVGRLRDAAEAAKSYGVPILLETHDAFPTGRSVASVLERVASPSVGALWDVVNPWRAGESYADTADALRPWLAHVQVKDVAAPDRLAPVLPGKGAIDLRTFASELDRIAYTGWLSLEWEAAWYPQADPLTEALSALCRLEFLR